MVTASCLLRFRIGFQPPRHMDDIGGVRPQFDRVEHGGDDNRHPERLIARQHHGDRRHGLSLDLRNTEMPVYPLGAPRSTLRASDTRPGFAAQWFTWNQ